MIEEYDVDRSLFLQRVVDNLLILYDRKSVKHPSLTTSWSCLRYILYLRNSPIFLLHFIQFHFVLHLSLFFYSTFKLHVLHLFVLTTWTSMWIPFPEAKWLNIKLISWFFSDELVGIINSMRQPDFFFWKKSWMASNLSSVTIKIYICFFRISLFQTFQTIEEMGRKDVVGYFLYRFLLLALLWGSYTIPYPLWDLSKIDWILFYIDNFSLLNKFLINKI